MYRVGIVEDNKEYQKLLERFLVRYGEKNGVNWKIDFFSNGLDLIDEYNPVYDILFLDIDMPFLDGMEAAERIRRVDEKVLIIFVTNLAQYAIKGYSVGAFDYILKPVSYEPFSMKIQKAVNILDKRTKRYLILSKNDEFVRVPVMDILYVEVINHQLIYHMKTETYQEYRSLKDVEVMLGKGFARCNNCYLVNLEHVKGIKDDYVLVGNDRLKISRPKKKDFMFLLSEYYQFRV